MIREVRNGSLCNSQAAKDNLNRYGSNYFLAKVECREYQADLRPTAIEKELRAQNGKPADKVLVAQR